MRKKIVAGNWKMNKLSHEAVLLADSIVNQVAQINRQDVTVIVAPPVLYIQQIYHLAEKAVNVLVAAQNCSSERSGAFTGEVSAEMISSVGAKYIIVGHSERRSLFNESNNLLKNKIDRILESGLTAIYCCGESLAEREVGSFKEVIRKQISEALFHLSEKQFSQIVIGYEPVWAIGTGKTAGPEQAQEVHHFIRSLIKEKYGKDVAVNTSIIYGGSCNPANSRDLFSQDDIDGGLIGGASLNAADFLTIVNSIPK